MPALSASWAWSYAYLSKDTIAYHSKQPYCTSITTKDKYSIAQHREYFNAFKIFTQKSRRGLLPAAILFMRKSNHC